MNSNTLAGIDARHAQLLTEAEQLLERAGDIDLEGDDLARYDELTAELDRLAARRDRLERIARHVPAGTAGDAASAPQLMRRHDPYDMADRRLVGAEVRGRALSAIEQTRGLSDDHKARATELVETIDLADGRLSRHLVTTGRPEYRSGFMKLAAGQDWALTAIERDAVEEARAASLTNNAGGFAIPFTLDPTLILTSTGSANPFRQVSRTSSIVTDDWQGVSTAGITAAWAGETTEASDDAPTLAQPSITVRKAQAFVPFSIEVGMDWATMEADLRRAFTDARDRLEGAAFAVGNGTTAPQGVVTGLIGTSALITSTATDTFAVGDVYRTMERTPAQHLAQSSWVAALPVINLIRQFGTAQNHAFLAQLSANTPPALLGRPLYVASDMDGTINATQENYILINGNFAEGYHIVDRVGMSVELVPHLFGANRRPTGQRGMYCFWRVGAGVVNSNAFTMLNVT